MNPDIHPLWKVYAGLSLQQKWEVVTVLAAAFTGGYLMGVWYQGFQVQRIELELERLRQSSLYPPLQNVQITSPKDGSYVDRFIDVEGTSSSPDGRSPIWVLIYSHSLKRYFPARNQARITTKTRWIAKNVEVGTEGDSDSSAFDIAVFLVNPDSAEMAQYLNTPDAEGFVTPMPGMYEQHRIKVSRR